MNIGSFLLPKRRLPWLPLTVGATHFSLEFVANILPVVFPLLIAQRGFTYSQIGTIALISGLCGSITQPLFGILVDRWDARKQVLLSIIWMGAGMGMVGFVGSFGWLIIVAGFAKLASAAYHPAGAALANFASNHLKGRSFSYFSVGGSVGSALCPLMISLALGLWGLNGTFFLVPIAILLATLLWTPLNQIEIEPAGAGGKRVRGDIGPIWAILPIIIVAGTRSWTSGTLTTYLPEWYASQGTSLVLAGSAFSLKLISTSVGSLIGGRVADRFGHERMVIFCMLALSGAFWGFLNLGSIGALVSLSLIGIVVGATIPSTLIIAQEAWPKAIGLASSLVMGVAWMPSSIGAWVVGLIADQSGLGYALSTLTFVPLVGALVLLLAYLISQRPVQAPL